MTQCKINFHILQIQVFTKNADRVELEKCVYTGILLSWGTSLVELDYEKSVKLPLLLCKGTKNTMKAVHITLGNMFDCTIVALSATEEDLKWLVPVVLQPSDEDEDIEQEGQARFEYKIPGEIMSNTIAAKYDISCLMDIWSAYVF